MKNHEELVKECDFYCIRGGNIPPPLSCYVLGRAIHQNMYPLALTKVRMDAFVSFVDETL